MNVKFLVDSIMQQTTVLIAHIATATNARAPLAHIAAEVLKSLADELDAQDVPKKVAADMFGMSLRTFQRRLSTESEDVESSWQKLVDFMKQRNGPVRRKEIFDRFPSRTDAQKLTLRSLLYDLQTRGLLFCTGTGVDRAYRAVSDEELEVLTGSEGVNSFLVWISVYRGSPISKNDLSRKLRISEEELEPVLDQLVEEDKIQKSDGSGAELYECRACVQPLGEEQGWEAGLLDQYQSVVQAMCAKLANGFPGSRHADLIGGSTYTFEVWNEHPHWKEVVGLLAEFRATLSSLRQNVQSYNDRAGLPAVGMSKLTFYCGQYLTETTEGEENGENAHS